ncbi:MAG: type II toxin-antitoxin system RelE/ParE family toxin [Gammaproteobacteria bacterium]|nr:type II toxin-antitoxin system RelE/ParE family toxin [Gammaproteobacteria bacterium]
MSRARLSPAAEKDLLGIVEWIADENPAAARAFRAAFDRLATTVAEHPRIGMLKPHIASPPIRFLAIRGFPYVVVYTPDPNPPVIIRVLHGARHLPEILRDL